ncbi:MAG: hypothetical protein HYV63_26020, partial [Candidatus Schekmanbacteria bacterium]|nr:hypothetical protein [Candidatus Schekmanbacteria bacterium]
MQDFSPTLTRRPPVLVNRREYGAEIAYEVDGSGRRIGEKIDGVLERAWLYQDALEPVAELGGDGEIVSIFVYASRRHVPDAMILGGTTYRILSDPSGSVRLVVDASCADGGAATAGELSGSGGLAVTPDGRLLVSDTEQGRVRAVEQSRKLATVAGSGAAGTAGDGELAAVATFDSPAGVTV